MKDLYLIGGPMGVGKTTAGRLLKEKLPRCAFLDGDWLWDMSPFQVTDETKKMVMGNILFVLRSFLACSAFDKIVFCWVMHRQEIVDEILSGLDLSGARVYCVSLVCDEQALRARIDKDVKAGLRARDAFARARAYLPLYRDLRGDVLDVTDMDAEATADAVIALGEGGCG